LTSWYYTLSKGVLSRKRCSLENGTLSKIIMAQKKATLNDLAWLFYAFN